jgi:hypothetical protein
MARGFGDPAARVILIAEWTGLAGRVVTNLEGRRLVFDDRRAQQNAFRTSLTAQADQISDTLPECAGGSAPEIAGREKGNQGLVSQIVGPLYERFDFLRLPAALPREELARMRANRF